LVKKIYFSARGEYNPNCLSARMDIISARFKKTLNEKFPVDKKGGARKELFGKKTN
jgi:hypothetical protein